ncbi:hypothetical protein Hanom_Chr00s000686g01654981 [Helianthus anomalus]
MTKRSHLVLVVCITSGSEIRPKSLTKKLPKALERASPGPSRSSAFETRNLDTPRSSSELMYPLGFL